jgi:hypothetical protein
MARLAALAVVAALSMAGCGDHSSSPTGPPAPQVLPGAFRCPSPEAPPKGDGGSDALPPGAEAARLCLRDNNEPWARPRGILSTGLDALVAVVNEQRVFHETKGVACGGVGAPAWRIVLRYRDGTRTISGDNGGCWDLLVGSTQRFGSRHVYDAYLRALLGQRRARGAPDVPPKAPPCPVRRSPADPSLYLGVVSPAAQPRLVAAGTWCRRVSGEWRPVSTATPAELALLRRDMRTTAHRRFGLHLDDCHGLPRGTHTLLFGRDPWGDPLEVDVTCDVYRLNTPPDPRARFVRLLPATRAMVASVVRR